jgi:hypothetical protein
MRSYLEDLAQARCQQRLVEADQHRRLRMASKLARAERGAAKATLRAQQAAAKIRVAVANLT